MIRSSELCEKFSFALRNNWGYIYGKSGQLWTQKQQDQATREQTVKWGQRWVDHIVTDCSGLAVWAFKQLGGNMYHGSNTIWNKYVCGRSELKNGVRTDGNKILPCDPVFLNKNGNRHHIGYYVGNGVCIEAKGTYYGVVTSPLSHWDETAHWKNVEYDGEGCFMGNPTLRKGDSGPDVANMQKLLIAHGYILPPTKAASDGADGIFGANTKALLMQFQKDHGIQADGVCGDQTWAALKQDPGENTGVIRVLTKEEAARLLEMLKEPVNYLEGFLK